MKRLLLIYLIQYAGFISAQTVLYPTARLIDSTGVAGDRLGASVSISSDGQTALVGIPFHDEGNYFDQGSALVYTRSGMLWVLEARLLASDGFPIDNFGNSVALSGDGNTALIGARGYNHNSNTDEGCAYIFVRSNNVWQQQAQLFGTNGAFGDNFGYSVAISDNGNTALIGVHQDNLVPNADPGSAYVFVRTGNTWAKQIELTIPGGQASENIGYNVALSGDGNTALLGARIADQQKGYCAVFYRSGTIWNLQTKLTASNAQQGDIFGSSLSLSYDGNTALIGAPEKQIGANPAHGAVYAFKRNGNSWTEQNQFSNTNPQPEDDFGRAVSLSHNGNWGLIGCSARTFGMNIRQGAAYLFRNTGTNWVQEAELLPGAEAGANNYTGQSVALSGDGITALVGAHNNDVDSSDAQGSAWVFDLSQLVKVKEGPAFTSVKIYPTVTEGPAYIDTDQKIERVRAFGNSGIALPLRYFNNRIDLRGLPSGWYVLEVKTVNKIYYGRVFKSGP